jgi:hypothetical protein
MCSEFVPLSKQNTSSTVSTNAEFMLCLQSEKEEKEVEKDVEENKQKEEKETK